MIRATRSKGAKVVASSYRSETFDVAEGHTRFAFGASGRLPDQSMPAHGNGFVTQGHVRREGTLDSAAGVTAAGEP
jgi:hypothetical protein